MTITTCVFCRIIAGELPSTKVAEWDDAIAIVPINPMTGDRFAAGDGHVLIIPRVHVADYATDPDVTASTFRRAAELARDRDSNLITSKGKPATQTVYHLHVHLVPREHDDGLPLPWTPQQADAEKSILRKELSSAHHQLEYCRQQASQVPGLLQDVDATRRSLLSILETARPPVGDHILNGPLSRLARVAAEHAKDLAAKR